MKIKNEIPIYKFVDLYGAECSVQKSSRATDDAVWIGVTNAEPMILGSKVRDDLTGWVKYPVPEDVKISTRMHLNRDQVKEFLPILQKFVDTGDI